MQKLPYWRTCLTLALALSIVTCRGDSDLREMAQLGEETYKQYRTADYPKAKEALLGFIRELEGRISDSNPNSGTYKADIMFSYARLAKLEEKNNGPEKENYTQKAISYCQQLKHRGSCSAQELRAAVDRMDTVPVK